MEWFRHHGKRLGQGLALLLVLCLSLPFHSHVEAEADPPAVEVCSHQEGSPSEWSPEHSHPLEGLCPFDHNSGSLAWSIPRLREVPRPAFASSAKKLAAKLRRRRARIRGPPSFA